MKPGRELDALVAEQVMGCEPDSHRCFCRDGEHAREPEHAIEQKFGVIGLKPYSTDIDAAWGVVEKLDKDFRAVIKRNLGGTWTAAFNGRYHQDHTGCTRSESVPHAICLAALEAVGGKAAA